MSVGEEICTRYNLQGCVPVIDFHQLGLSSYSFYHLLTILLIVNMSVD